MSYLSFLVIVGYFVVQEGLFGATLGKAFMRLRVVNAPGKRLTWGAASKRGLLRPIDYPLIGVILVGTSLWHQRWGDLWGKTLVIGTESLPEPLYPKGEIRRKLAGVTIALALLLSGMTAYNYYARPLFLTLTPHAIGQWQGSCVTDYTLGAPTRNGDTVTYPATYEIAKGQLPAQSGTVTLQWHGPWTGWAIDNISGTTCTDPPPTNTYP